MTTPLRVGVFGAVGQMGTYVCAAVADDPALDLVAAVDPHHAGMDLRSVTKVPHDLNVAADAEALVAPLPEVMVDFTHHDAAVANLRWCAQNGVHAVVGTTGFDEDDLEQLRTMFTSSNCVVAPNFAIGAILMMRFAEMAAPWFETAEIIELHHDQKLDAPSGTAMLTLDRMTEASDDWAPDPTKDEVMPSARGAEGRNGVRVHSVRLRGLVAHQEVLLGTTGQSLSIRHDSFDRSSFMPGVLLAVKEVPERPGVTVGLDSLLGL